MKVDTRAGSERLIPHLEALGVLVEPGILPAGDVEILGNGPGGKPLLVGVEHKTIEDAVACMRNGRFAEQARGMAEYYDVRWLCVEGELRIEKTGELSVRRGSKWFELPGVVRYQELASWLMSMAQGAGILLYRTKDKEESAKWLRSLELWWTAKEWEEHRAHLDWFTPPGVGNPFQAPSLVAQAAALLPGIGVGRAVKVGQHFKSVKRMCLATEKEWCSISQVGKGIAKKVVKAIEEER